MIYMDDSHQRYIAVHSGNLLTSKKHFQLYRLSGTVPLVCCWKIFRHRMPMIVVFSVKIGSMSSDDFPRLQIPAYMNVDYELSVFLSATWKASMLPRLIAPWVMNGMSWRNASPRCRCMYLYPRNRILRSLLESS